MKFNLSQKFFQRKGQILLGILISVAIFAILVHALFTLISSSYEFVNFNRARITARHIASEKIEIVRNLAYEDIGTKSGIPLGILDQEENILRNGLNFLVKTSIIYIDDDFDDTAPADTQAQDYKRVRVEVSWEGLAASGKNPVVLITDVAPQQATPSSGGTLTIFVFDANGESVAQAQIRIVALSLNPPIDTPYTTGDDGTITLPGTPACNSCYEITVTKADCSEDRTYSESEVANPIKPHASVLEGEVTQVSFYIDTLGDMSFSSVDNRENNFSPRGNVEFRLRGNKIIGTDTLGQPVYKNDSGYTTDGSGSFNASDIEWDTYHVLMPETTGLDISGSTPLQPLSLLPDGNLSFTFATDTHTEHGLLITVKDPSQNLIASASARLYNGEGFNETKTTGISDDPDFGQAFFPNLEEKTYQIEATASGHLDFNGNFDVSGYTKAEVVLTPE